MADIKSKSYFLGLSGAGAFGENELDELIQTLYPGSDVRSENGMVYIDSGSNVKKWNLSSPTSPKNPSFSHTDYSKLSFVVNSGDVYVCVSDDPSDADDWKMISGFNSISDTDIDDITDGLTNITDTDTLKAVLEDIDNQLGTFSTTDTDSADSISITDSGGYTDEENVEDALQEIYGNQGSVSFSGGENVDLSGESDITSVINLLRDYVANNYSAIRDGIVGVARTVLATQATEQTTSGASGDTQDVIDDTVYIGEDDIRIRGHYKAKAGSGGCVVNLYLDGTKVASKPISETSYTNFEITHTLDKTSGNYSIKLEIEETVGVAQTVYCKLASLYKESAM